VLLKVRGRFWSYKKAYFSLSPIEGLKIATGKRPLNVWIISSAIALLKV
jgi:hypothetical protein